MTLSNLSNDGFRPVAEATSILIVDDDRVVCEMCEHILKDYRVFRAGSCSDALQIYQKERCDLILTDVMMPGGTGIELLSQVKALDPNAVVILMTGFSHKEVILEALKEGADDFINKPINLLQLKSAVERALGRRRLKEELTNLKRLDRLKSNFLSLISHKLRTPITSISLFLQNVQNGVYDPKDDGFLESVKFINDEVEYLGGMVTSLLSFSRVMEGRDGLNLEPCDLNSVIMEVIQESQGKEGIETEFLEAQLPTLQLDRVKINFALKQIIENAYKFSGETGRVSISFRGGEDSVDIIVADSGIGIPRDEIAKVFEKFYQFDPDNTGQVRGFGLGLFYAKEFVHQHGGNITIESESGHGSTVTVTLPMQ
jgi:two-component system sensor histidine kinase/response regulator